MMFVLLMIFWILLNQRITVEIFCFGLIISLMVCGFMKMVFDYEFSKDLHLLKKVPLFLFYVLVLIKEVLKASWTMICVILNKKIPIEPTLVTFKTGLKTEFGNYLLANSITLTPGTITVQAHDDELMVHCLRRDFLDTSENSIFIQLIHRLED